MPARVAGRGLPPLLHRTRPYALEPCGVAVRGHRLRVGLSQDKRLLRRPQPRAPGSAVVAL
eukprot:13529039-Heterocapsa_arctica.AAC.1